ncbi:Fic family protein [Halalkalibacillus halophilus]|uniref:Fic family protein n=1 Tax=Halalkalibacillus halophilus TaxID=392827 RepID=UPI00040DB828|nr:Fic family protein [Halalkalibacillus halophilus]
MKPYELPFLPVKFEAEVELSFYKKVVEATSKLEKLKQKINYSVVNESFIQLLTLQESVQSTRIEGTQVTFSEMLEDEVSEQSPDWEKVEVRNYRRALKLGVEAIKAGYPITERLLRDMHRELMKDARGAQGTEGDYRRIQNFIGPSKNIKDASYIPPEPQTMGDYMSNLEMYMNGHPYIEEEDLLHPLLKSAIIHAQFESIHPFLDGNGRLGRILIVLYMLQSKLIDSPSFFLSEELEREKFKYYAMLNGIRRIGKKQPDWESWIHFFLDSTIRMADHQYNKLDRAEKLYNEGLDQLSISSTKYVWKMMMTYPIATVKTIESRTGLAATTIRKSFRELVEKQLVYQDDRVRNKKYYQYDLIRIMSENN